MAAKKKRQKRPSARANSSAYSEILEMMDQLLDTADDDLSRAAMDPLAALRVKCQTLTTALRISLLALSCHGQKEDFARQIAQNIDTIIAIKDKWNGQASQEDSGQAAIQSLIEESQQESQQGNPEIKH